MKDMNWAKLHAVLGYFDVVINGWGEFKKRFNPQLFWGLCSLQALLTLILIFTLISLRNQMLLP